MKSDVIKKEQNARYSERYLTPNFEVVNIQFMQNILQGSANTQELPDMGGELW